MMRGLSRLRNYDSYVFSNFLQVTHLTELEKTLWGGDVRNVF